MFIKNYPEAQKFRFERGEKKQNMKERNLPSFFCLNAVSYVTINIIFVFRNSKMRQQNDPNLGFSFFIPLLVIKTNNHDGWNEKNKKRAARHEEEFLVEFLLMKLQNRFHG